MDKNSLILEIKNDLNSIKKQVEVALAKLTVLESMIELDKKLGDTTEVKSRDNACIVREQEQEMCSDNACIVRDAEPEQEPESEIELEEELEEGITPHSSLLTPNCKTQEFRNLMSIIGLNDRFRFRHDLFSDDNDLFRETIEILNTLEDFEKAVDFLEEKFNWDPEDATVVYFYDIIKPKF
ncbi:MAG: hypothetical protein IKJ22_04720 [Paludibacteraceae bacterium]|nr:hypothetical protein [Paludibacteraceae bacterium]